MKTLFTTLDPTMCSGWHIHDLTYPDLFFKGLAVCPHQVSIKIDPNIHGRYVFITPEKGAFSMKYYDKPNEIPQKFWECWAEVEGANNLTKEGA